MIFVMMIRSLKIPPKPLQNKSVIFSTAFISSFYERLLRRGALAPRRSNDGGLNHFTPVLFPITIEPGNVVATSVALRLESTAEAVTTVRTAGG